MTRTPKQLLQAACLALLPSAVIAEDVAVFFVNSTYSQFVNVPAAQLVRDLAGDFERAGFRADVIESTGTNVTAAQSEALLERMADANRLVIVLAGHIVGTRGQTWLLHSDAGPMTALTVGQEALAAEPFFDLLEDRQGRATLILADARVAIQKGTGVTEKPRIAEIPQGVTVVEGDAAPVARFVREELLDPSRSLHQAAQRAPEDVSVRGFLPRRQRFVSAPVAPPTGGDRVIEDRLWVDVRRVNTVASYDRYLRRYPRGRYAQEAAKRRDELALTPQDRARLAEEALDLSRDQRRALQRQLTLLGFDTKGVDGILGRNSRTAIGAWQRSVSVPATGYVTANQINRIQAAAAIRAEELRLEAERRRQEEMRRDRAFWNRTGASGLEADLRRYLGRFPDGIYADEATDQLRIIERQRRREARRAEREAWDQAVLAGTLQSYEAYLASYPDGLFAEEARAQIAALRNPETPNAVVAAAKLEEEQLSLNQFSRTLIERQLSALNLDPGKADGRFTAKTRRALRQYQRATNQPVTGYVTRDTVVELLASAL